MQKICIHVYLSHCKSNSLPPGFGDFLRGTVALFEYSKKYGYTLYIDQSHLLFSFLENNEHFIGVHDFQVIEVIPPLSYEEISDQLHVLFLQDQSFAVLTNSFYSHDPLRNFGDISSDCKTFLKRVLTPIVKLENIINEAYANMGIDISKGYSIIHFRCADEYLADQERVANESEINNLSLKLERLQSQVNKEMQYIFICGSSSISFKMKEKNPSLFYWMNEKIHLGGLQHKDLNRGISETLADFFIMSRADKIYSFNNGPSGFSYMCSLIYDINYVVVE